MENTKKIPVLRFPEFSGEWEVKKVSQILKPVSEKVEVKENELYKQIGIRSHGKGIFYKESVSGESLGNKRVFWIKENVFVVNIVFAWEQAIAKTTENEIGMIASHRFPMYQPLNNLCSIDYILYFFLTKKGKSLLELASPGGAGRNKTLGQSEFKKLKFLIPSVSEQQKIADFLTCVDSKIEQLTKKKQLLESYKKAVMQKIFSQELRFKDDNGNYYPDWEVKKLEEIGKFYRGHSYTASDVMEEGILVLRSSNIQNNNLLLNENLQFVRKKCNENIFLKKNDIVICMANGSKNLVGKSAIYKGNYNEKITVGAFCSIFRSENILANFLFKIEKYKKYLNILLAGTNINNLKSSDLEKLKFKIPSSIEEQTKIANFLTSIDDKISLVEKQLNGTKQYKKGLLQQMFV